MRRLTSPRSASAAHAATGLGEQAERPEGRQSVCLVCGRDPKRMNNAVAECSHIDCTHRRTQWSDGTGTVWRPETTHDPLGPLFDEVD
jgi:hypothetical protein